MREVTYSPREILDRIDMRESTRRRLLKNSASRKALKWVSENMSRLLDDCPECGACEEEGQEHGPRCEYR